VFVLFPFCVQLASVPLREIGSTHFPIIIACGCLVDYGGRRWILTVAHATGNMGSWVIELEYVEGRGLKQYRIGAMEFLKLGDLSKGTLEDLDLAYAEVPADLQPYCQPRNDQGQIVKTMPRVIFQSDLLHRPNAGHSYGFAGGVKPTEEPHFGMRWHGTGVVCHTGLTFAGEDEKFYFFKLPFGRPANEFLEARAARPSATMNAMSRHSSVDRGASRIPSAVSRSSFSAVRSNRSCWNWRGQRQIRLAINRISVLVRVFPPILDDRPRPR